MKLRNLRIIIITFLAWFFCVENVAVAQELIEKFHDWSVFRANRGDKIVCYVASVPIKHKGNYHKRGESFLLVSEIENDADEISTSSGFIYSKKSNVELSFGSKKFYLFPHEALAWAVKKSDDIEIIKEMQKSSDIIISGVNESGKIAIDTYSLIGFSDAYQTMKKKCHERKSD